MKKGLSVINKILLFAFILLVGFGFYTAYMFYTDENFEFYGLRPSINNLLGIKAKAMPHLAEELQKYAVGKDAELFLIFRMDDIPPFGDDQPQMEMIKDLNTVLVLGKACDNCLFGSDISAAALFNTEAAARNFQKIYNENASTGLLTVSYKTVVEGNVVTIGKSQEPFSDFTGRLADNPNLVKIREENLNKNFIFYADNTRIPEFSMVIFSLVGTYGSSMSYTGYIESFLKSAHAQGLISPTDQPARLAETTGGTGSLRQLSLTLLNYLLGISKEMYGYVDYESDSIKVDLHISLPTREEFTNLPSIKMYYEGSTKEQLDNFYELTIGNKDSVTQLVNESITKLKDDYPDLQVNFNSNDLIIDFSMRFNPESFAPNSSNPGDAPSRARDAARMADINNIIVVIETYNSDYGTYPQSTDCVGNITDLQKYFKSKKAPTDFKGSRTFETQDGSLKITCEDGYLYQNFGNGEYILWAQPENASMGKMEYLITDKIDYLESEQGRYFTYGTANNNIKGEMLPYNGTEKKKVSRTKL